MVDIKEIKSIRITSFTKMLSSIHAILAFIVAVVLLITLIILEVTGTMPQFGLFKIVAGVGIPLIIIYPIAAFFITLAVSFFTVMIYNMLASRIGGVELELEGTQVTKIPVISFALVLAGIEAIWAFVVGLFLVAVVTPVTTFASDIIPVISSEIPKYLNTTNVTFPTGPTGASAGTEGIVLALLLIIGFPIMAFVFGFIGHALFAIFYNYIATRVSKIKLEFATVTGNLHELKSVPVMPTALAVAIVFAIFGLIQGILNMINYGIFYLVKDILGNFVEYFIITALIVLIYNFLAPKIGRIRLELE